VRGTPVEIAESQSPLVFWRKELREDSAGAGATRGGYGQVMQIASRVDKPFRILAAFDRVNHPPRGRDGGTDGAAGYVGLASGKRMRGKGGQDINAGEVLVIMTPGGAGLGNPHQRDRQDVAGEVASGLISPAAAAQLYGFTQD
jgi:N-methylhydantoinase B